MRIMRGVGSRVLPCGCLVGLYETYDGKTIAVVDARAPACTDKTHRVSATVSSDVRPPSRDVDLTGTFRAREC